ncbi:MAG TPA: ATP-binding cassette domain-containing protein [Bryobacteraceae bacterium]|jgi:phospholipid/cholesterol/gamma-HCH transport system ATP-binding protein|nr:ATP-binding cassette domain-containing protein [Bryobacteraceae bacterium]
MESNNAQTPVEIRDLRKSFGEQRVLNGITLSVAQNQTVAVLGRSGTGKSVLLKLLVGLQPADSGSVRIAGAEISGLDTRPLNEIRKKMGYLFQQGALYDSLTVEQNVDFPLTRHADLPEDQRKNKVREMLLSVGMSGEDFDKMPSEISGGMQKRVGLARALVLDPEILLLDEPTAGLDPITSAEIGQLIIDLKKKHSVTAVVVTHDIHRAKTFSDLLVLLDKGNIVAQGTFEELQKSKDDFVIRFLGKD